jgi:hypothetical protein
VRVAILAVVELAALVWGVVRSGRAVSPKCYSGIIEKLRNKLVCPNFLCNSSSHFVLVIFTLRELPLARQLTAIVSSRP